MTQLTIDQFDAVKAGQLIFYFLNKAVAQHMNITKLRLIKWLYLAERAAYQEFGEPMIGDRLGALRHGPAPSETLSLIEGTSHIFKQNPWKNILSVDRIHRHQYVTLVPNCTYSSIDDLDRFSEAEIELLDSVWAKYGKWTATSLEKHLHDTNIFPEWNWKEGDGTNWIDLETTLKVVGFKDDEVGPMVKRIMSFSIQQQYLTSQQ